MDLMQKSDLRFTDYSWKASDRRDDPRVTGKPDSTLFSRHEGYEVLYLINAIAAEHRLASKADGHKLERMIRQHLPSDVRSQADVKRWLEQNWPRH